MRIHFLGAAGSVTGSMHLLEVNGRRLLLECGLAQGRRKETFELNRNLPFDPATIDALVLSHAHIDHSGNLPSLARKRFAAAIYCTPATHDLCQYMLRDAAHIQESDVAYLNKRRGRQGKDLVEALYTQADAEAILERFRSVAYDQPFEPVSGVQARFIDAGHILGSAVVVLDITEKGRTVRLAFSGDLGRTHHPLLRDPEVPENVDYVLMESTYGDRQHEPLEESNATFHALVRETAEKRGKLLIPAFALGRTQELVYSLDQFERRRELPPIDVYVDSPLAVNVTEVFRRHAECFNAEARAALAREPDHDPLAFPRLRYVQSVEESKRLNELQAPAIILSASGMCESGRILHHLKNNLGDPRTTVLFVGFQAQHTLGRKLLEGMNPVPILGETYAVKAQIKQIGGYSAHADRTGLLAWAAAVQKTGGLKRVFLVHGEETAAAALADGLRQQGLPQVDIPTRGQVFEL